MYFRYDEGNVKALRRNDMLENPYGKTKKAPKTWPHHHMPQPAQNFQPFFKIGFPQVVGFAHGGAPPGWILIHFGYF